MNGFLHVARVRAAIMVALAMAVSGCAPTIQQFQVGQGEPGEHLPVSAQIQKNQTTIQGVDLATRPVNGTFSNAGSLSGSSGTGYSGQTPRLGPGEYEAQLAVRYHRLLLPGMQTKTATRSFSLAWPDGTFAFETSADGWTYKGVLGTSEGFQQCDPATLVSFPHFSVTTAGWPTGINDTNPGYPSGALRVIVSPSCYPDQADEVVGTFWQFNLVSPDLSNNPEWQGINGVSFRMISTVPGGIKVMATVVYEDENGDDTHASPMVGNVLDFMDIGPGWSIVEKTGYVPDRPIRRILVRVFGRPELLAGTAGSTVLLDVVSPLRE